MQRFRLLAPFGEIAFVTVWSIYVVGASLLSSGVGGLVFLPSLVLLAPYWLARRAATRSAATNVVLPEIALSITLVLMGCVALYIYTLIVMSYCPTPLTRHT